MASDGQGKLPVAARGLVGFPPNKDGSIRIIWRAPKRAVARGYLPKTVKIDLDVRDPSHHDTIRLICDDMNQQVADWEVAQAPIPHYDGTLGSLIKLYQSHEASPYRSVKFTTRRDYDYELRLLDAAWGSQMIAGIRAVDITRLYKAAIASGDGHPAIRKAHGVVKRLRALCSFGVMVEIPDAIRLDSILSKMRFENPGRRNVVMTFDQAKAIIAKAIEKGRLSVALAQAIQFETGLRQVDVIGQYAPLGDKPRRIEQADWTGLTWEMIDASLVLNIRTSKTGAFVTHALAEMPLVTDVLALVDEGKRQGPVIVNEMTGLPYRGVRFSRVWREIADEAGVPANIWNRDSRAGALSEGDEAGVDIRKLQSMAGHTTAKMTGGYVRGRAVERSAEIARARAEKRARG